MVALAVDEERRRAGHVAAIGGIYVRRDPGRTGVLAQVPYEPVGVETKLSRVTDQVLACQRVLVLKEQVMHFPERALHGRRLGSLRGELGVRVDVVEREMPPCVAQVAEVGEQFAHDRFRLAAVGALEIAVLNDGDRRFLGSAQVVAGRVDGYGKIDDYLGCPEQRADPQPLGEQRGYPEDAPGDRRRAQGGRQDAELRLLELVAVETQ